MKGRLKGAETGHSLLKKKADALTIRFRSILKKIIDVRRIKKERKRISFFFINF
jgi:V-type H+-transporting ATPase subunit D